MAARAAYLLARDALLPWRSVRKNVKLPLDIRGQLSADRHHEITADLIKQVGLAGYENHAIKQLSHGMRPRVSLARILTGGFLAAQAMAARPGQHLVRRLRATAPAIPGRAAASSWVASAPRTRSRPAPTS